MKNREELTVLKPHQPRVLQRQSIDTVVWGLATLTLSQVLQDGDQKKFITNAIASETTKKCP